MLLPAGVFSSRPHGSFFSSGKTITRAEGADKVSGKAAYAADRVLPGMVWGKAVRSALPHARIRRVDTSKAKAYSGVLAVVTADDVPDVLVGRHLQDTPVLARERVRFIGEKIAVVGAETREIADQAAALIDVDYEELRQSLTRRRRCKKDLLCSILT